jgi:hypothetical protein
MLVPLEVGRILFRNRQALNESFEIAAHDLREGDGATSNAPILLFVTRTSAPL